MLADQPRLSWTVPAGGYRWVPAEYLNSEGKKLVGPALVEAEPAAPRSPAASSTAPEAHPALFLLVAAVPPDQDGVLAFANRYGNLGFHMEIRPLVHSGARTGVPLTVWLGTISDVQRLTALWGLIKRGEEDKLACYFSLRKAKGPAEDASVAFDSHPKAGKGGAPPLGFLPLREEIPVTDAGPELVEKARRGEMLPLALRYLQRELDAYLYHSDAALEPRMGWDAGRLRPRLVFGYPTLAAAIWGELAKSVSEDRLFATCKECGTPFEVAPELARTNRRFCSNGCRSKAYRERQDRARRLFTARKTFEQIAEELDSDAATVKRWITGSKE
jgi:hypothetical protein